MALLAVPVLQGIGFCLEAFGWRGILASLGARVSFRTLLGVRIVSEALSQSIPLGVLFAEGSKPLLLRTRTGVAIPIGAASVAARKYSLVVTQAALLGAIARFGGAAIARLGARLPGGPATLRVIVAAGSVVLALSAGASDADYYAYPDASYSYPTPVIPPDSVPQSGWPFYSDLGIGGCRISVAAPKGFAEAEDSAWAPLSVERGFAPGTSTVTLFAGEGVQGIVDQKSRTPESLARTFAACMRVVDHPKLAMAGDARKGEAGKAPAKGPHKAASRGPKAA
jgi:hypothetical protein